MAFSADPRPIEIRAGGLGDNFSIVQMDMDRSLNRAAPDQPNILQPNQFIYEREPGAETGTIRIDNLMSTNRGPMQNAISTSRPIIIRRIGQPDLLLEPDRNGSTWSPLKWYTIMHGVRMSGPAFAAGNTVYTAGTSKFPDILAGTPPLSARDSGILMGMNVEVAPNDRFLKATSSRPWLKQMWVLDVGTAGNPVAGNPNIRWPQLAGATSFSDYTVRLRQTQISPPTSEAYGVMGGEGALFGIGSTGVHGFSRADFLVAEEGRVSRFDSSGNPIWTSDAAANTGVIDASSVASVKPLVRPTRAYRLSENRILVVDSGSNRIALLDVTGREIRSISGIALDPTSTNRPEGWESSSPLTFNEPRDVLYYTTYEANPTGVTNPQALEYWIHYLVADRGNKRLVELIDRYNADPVTRRIGDVIVAGGENQLNILKWQTPSNFSGKNFDYTSVSRIFIDDAANPRYVYAAGIGGTLPTRVDAGQLPPSDPSVPPRESSVGNGGVVIFDGATSQIVSEITTPAIPADRYWNDTTLSFNSPAQASRRKRLSNVASVTMRNVVVGPNEYRTAIMIADASGVYEIYQPTAGGDWVVRWMLTNEAYRVTRRLGNTIFNDQNPRALRATFARRLDSGDVLIVNNYYGSMRNNLIRFEGEVLQVEGEIAATAADPGYHPGKVNLGFDATSVQFQLPPVQGTRGIRLPVFADRR
jgi:hypothetical protein